MKGKYRRWKLIGILLLSCVALSACGSLELGIMTPESADAGLGIPEGVIIAREVAMGYLRETYPGSAPPDDLQWQGEYISEGAYRYTAESWVVTIEHPIVAAEATAYTIGVVNQASDFDWQGRVDAQGYVSVPVDESAPKMVVAWPGHIARLPVDRGNGFTFKTKPERAGEFEIVGADGGIDAVLSEVADGESTMEFVHVWGKLTCGVDAFNGCQLVANRIRYGTEVTEPEPIEGWEGVIYASTQPPGSGGDDFFVLTGEYSIEYGIWSQDETLRNALESLRDTGSVVQLWGQIVVGVPDWMGTQIRVERLETIDPDGTMIPAQPTPAADDRGWETYVNERYGYEISFPPEAVLEEMGIHGYVTDEQGKPIGDIPEGLEPDEIFEYLRQTYGENLCVQITSTLGYITISAPENAEFRYATCGRTGVGVGELISKEELVQIDGMEIIAEGFEFRSGGESLQDHNETFHLILPDGTRIEYSSRVVAGATFQDYLIKGKPVLMEILSSYRTR